MNEDDIIQRVRMILDEKAADQMERDMERHVRRSAQRSARAMTAPRDELGRFQRSNRRVIGSFISGWGGAFGRIGRMVTSMQFALGGLTVGVLLKQLTDANRQAQSLQAQLRVTEGSDEAAMSRFAAIEEFARTTPFQIEEVTQAFLDLRTAGIQPTAEMMESFGDLASARGKTIRNFTAAVQDALTGEMERLKEFGIVSKQQGDQVAFTFNGQTQVVDRTRESILGYLQSVGQMEGVQGSMAGQMQTLNGVISNLQDNMGAFARIIGEEGFTEAASGAGRETISWTDKLNQNRDAIGKWTRGIIGTIRIVGSLVAVVARTITNLFSIMGRGIGLAYQQMILRFNETRNEAASLINWIVDQLNKIPGVEIDLQIGMVNLEEQRANVRQLADNIGQDFRDIADSVDDLFRTAGDSWRHFRTGGTTDEQRNIAGAFGDGSIIGGESGVGAGAMGGTKDALQDEIGLLGKAREMRLLRNADIIRAWEIEEDLRKSLAQTNLTLQERVDLEQKLKAIQGVTGGGYKANVVDGGLSRQTMTLPALRMQFDDDERSIVDEAMSYMRDNAVNTSFAMTSAFQGFFDAFAEGIEGSISLTQALGSAAKSLAGGVVRSMLEGWADFAMMRGTAALAEGIWPPNPVALFSAGKWFAAAGLARSLENQLGAGGASRVSVVATNPGGQQAQGAPVQPSIVNVYIDPLDPNRPAYQQNVVAAGRLGTERMGRDSDVNIYPASR